jgi:hypothetical protein
LGISKGNSISKEREKDWKCSRSETDAHKPPEEAVEERGLVSLQAAVTRVTDKWRRWALQTTTL